MQIIQKAEKRLHISAQQLGRIVTSIEDEFGVSIFERTNLGLHLTKRRGRIFNKGEGVAGFISSNASYAG